MNGLSFTPDAELARREDVHALRAHIDGLEVRMGELEARMDALEARMDRLEARIGELETRTRLEIEGVEHRIVAALRGEIVSQTRFYAVTMGAVVVALVGAMAALG